MVSLSHLRDLRGGISNCSVNHFASPRERETQRQRLKSVLGKSSDKAQPSSPSLSS